MRFNGSVEEYEHLSMLRAIDNLILYKMIEDYTNEPVPDSWSYYSEFNEYRGIFYDDLWEGLITFVDNTIGEASLDQDTLQIEIHSYKAIFEEENEALAFHMDSIFREIQALKCTVWDEDGFVYLYLEDFDFESHLIAELLLKIDKICLEIGEKK